MNPNGGQQDDQQHSAAADGATHPAPIMDVVAPRGDTHVAAAPTTEESAPHQESQDQAANSMPDNSVQNEIKRENIEKAQKAQPIKALKHPGSGVGLAITGTVIIVLGLAALAVYAYIKTR